MRMGWGTLARSTLGRSGNGQGEMQQPAMAPPRAGRPPGASAELPAAGSSRSPARGRGRLENTPREHASGLRKNFRHCIDGAFDCGVFGIQTAAIFAGGREDKWVKSTQAFAFQLFPSRPAAWTSSGLILALGSFQQSLETQVLPCMWVDIAALLPGVSNPSGSYFPEGLSEEILYFWSL